MSPEQQQQPESEPSPPAPGVASRPDVSPACVRHVWMVCGPDNGIDEKPDRVCLRCGLEI